MEKKIILIGGGGHAKVVIDAVKCAKKFEIYGIVDPALRKDDTVLGIPVIGNDSVLPKIFKDGIKYAFIAVGSIGNCIIRKKIYDNLKKIGFKLPIIVHPKVAIAKDVELGEGTFVAAGVVINPSTKIGKNVIVNTHSSIDHDCLIGDFVHIAPGVTLSGGVIVKDEAHIGTSASIVQGINIGKRNIVPAGYVVRDNLYEKDK